MDTTVKSEFKQFDTVNDSFFTDHHYYYRRQKKFSEQTIERITRECDILREGLPADSIFVRANKAKPDLLKAVIIGPEGTPHHDGLFFFDIYFPSRFPMVPPKIRSLYAPGLYFFLPQPHSLWNPSTTLLESLLCMLKSLIRRGDFMNRNVDMFSLTDKQQIYAFNWRTMADVLDKPPKHFESFVARHFYDRAVQILTTCKAYISKRVDTVDLPVNIRAPWQEEFERMERHYYMLVNAFQKNGSSLDDGLAKLGIEFRGEPACSLPLKMVAWVGFCLVIVAILVVAYSLVREIMDHGLI